MRKRERERENVKEKFTLLLRVFVFEKKSSFVLLTPRSLLFLCFMFMLETCLLIIYIYYNNYNQSEINAILCQPLFHYSISKITSLRHTHTCRNILRITLKFEEDDESRLAKKRERYGIFF